MQKDTAVVVHLQHAPGGEESSTGVSANTSTAPGKGQPPPAPHTVLGPGEKPAEQRGRGSAHPARGREGGGCWPGQPYLLQMLQWWVRAGLGAMHFLQMETPVTSFLACTQVRRGDTTTLSPAPRVPRLPCLPSQHCPASRSPQGARGAPSAQLPAGAHLWGVAG